MEKWMYDIILDNKLVGDNGDFVFDTKEEAAADAKDYVLTELTKEYNTNSNRFEIDCYLGFA